jgi:hypothetical protein
MKRSSTKAKPIVIGRSPSSWRKIPPTNPATDFEVCKIE